MNAQTLGILIPLSAIIGGILMIIITSKFKNDERMAMIEKGIPLTDNYDLFNQPKSNKNKTNWPLLALLAIGSGIGLLIALLIEESELINIQTDSPVIYFAMLLLFGGLGILTYYFLEPKFFKKKD